ncbi:MAG: universal stress protein [Brooklawnia sp.]|jgi:nucleotide-binding universal stress UspA family protein
MDELSHEAGGRIVVGTDGSERAFKAVEWAAQRAVARGLPLLVLHVVPERLAARSMIPNEILDEREVPENRRAELDEVVARLKRASPELQVNAVVVEGYPAYVLAQWAKLADLVVLGARGEGAPLSVRLLGGVSDEVTAHARGPVAIIGDQAHEHPGGPVVLGVDDSVEAQAAANLAFDAAETRGVPLHAIHAYDYGPQDSFWWPSGVLASETFKEQLAERVSELLAEPRAAHPSVQVEIEITGSRPGNALVRASRQAGLVVVGSRGRGGFAGLLLGSTSKQVLREAECPVIVVPTRAGRHLEDDTPNGE